MNFWKDYKKVKANFGNITAIKIIIFPRILRRLFPKIDFYGNSLRKFLRGTTIDIIEEFKNEPLIKNSNTEEISPKIFSFWLQGDHQFPDVVKLCRESVQYNYSAYEFVSIDLETVRRFLDLPSYIYRKLQEGKISYTHFSDIIRVGLLSKYGGLWIDSCLYCIRPLEFTQNFNTIRLPLNDSPCEGRWCIGVMSAPPNHKLMRFMYTSLLRYWKRYDVAIDYLMMDNFMRIGYEEFSEVKKEIDSLKYSSPNLHESRYLFDKVIDWQTFSKLIHFNDFLSLTWRIKYPAFKNNQLTYYGALKNYHKLITTNGQNNKKDISTYKTG